MLKVSTFLVYLLIGLEKFSSAVFGLGLGSIREIAKFGDDVADVFNGEVPFGALLIGSEDYKLDQVLDKIDGISDQLTELTETVNKKMDKILVVLLNRIPLQNKGDKAMDDFHQLIVRIDGLYADFKRYSKRLKKFNKRTIQGFVDSVTSTKTGDLRNILNRMHRLFVPSRSGFFQKGLLQTLSSIQDVADPVESCNLDYSFHQRLYEIYKTIVVSELRGFVMTVFSYMLLTAKHNEAYTGELESAVAQLVMRSKDYMTTVQTEMKRASREIKFCGAERLKSNQWGEFTGLYSWIVVNEMQTQEELTCWYTCNDIWTPKLYRDYLDYDYYPRIDCVGKIYSCGWIGETTICDQPDNSPKRYEWVDTDNRRYGPSNVDCPSSRKTYMNYVNYGFSRCDNCLCKCLQESATAKVVRTFNLRPQISDVENNMVVVAVKFTAKDDMIHVQIQQGKLLEQGKIDKASEKWVPLEDFVYLSNVTDGGFSLNSGERLTRGEDFTFIAWDQQRINLDDVILPSEYVITGVRLNHEKQSDITSPVEIQVRATIFDYNSGKLNTEEDSSQWFTVRNMPNPSSDYLQNRKEYEYPGETNDPTKSPINEPMSKANQFTKFNPSSSFTTAGNYTLPLFDLRPVTATPSIALGGVGIYLKHGEEYGGFLALKVFTFDFSTYINPVLTDEQAENYEGIISSEEVDESDEDEDDENNSGEEEDDE